jgi:transcriptional regulator with XRE-family HTH domain
MAKNINKNIRVIRLLREITVKQAAAFLSVSEQAYRKIESGETNVSPAHKANLAIGFCVPEDFFEAFDARDILPPL